MLIGIIKGTHASGQLLVTAPTQNEIITGLFTVDVSVLAAICQNQTLQLHCLNTERVKGFRYLYVSGVYTETLRVVALELLRKTFVAGSEALSLLLSDTNISSAAHPHQHPH